MNSKLVVVICAVFSSDDTFIYTSKVDTKYIINIYISTKSFKSSVDKN